MRRPLSVVALALVALLWSSALVAAPAVTTPHAAAVVYTAGSFICHQQSERSFHVAGVQLPVCARCVGLYVGGLFGVLAWGALAGLGRRPAPRTRRWLAPARLRRMLMVGAAPTLFTVATAWLGLWDPGNAIRASLAVPLGAIATALITAVAAGDLR